MATQTLIQRYGVLLDDKEENLQSRLEILNAHLNAPDRLRVIFFCKTKFKFFGEYFLVSNFGNF